MDLHRFRSVAIQATVLDSRRENHNDTGHMHDAIAFDAIICPDNRHRQGDVGALDEAFDRIRAEYHESLAGWRASGIDPVFHVKLTIERPEVQWNQKRA